MDSIEERSREIGQEILRQMSKTRQLERILAKDGDFIDREWLVGECCVGLEAYADREGESEYPFAFATQNPLRIGLIYGQIFPLRMCFSQVDDDWLYFIGYGIISPRVGRIKPSRLIGFDALKQMLNAEEKFELAL